MLNIRLTLCGDGAVGKTSIRKRYMGEGFKSNYLATLGADFSYKKFNPPNAEEPIMFAIWDLAGQPAYGQVRKAYYDKTMGGLVIFDCTRPITFSNVKFWIDELWEYSGLGKIPILLIGNKYDLVDELSESVDLKKGKKLARKLTKELEPYQSKVEFLQTSAKTGLNINEAFTLMGNNVVSYFLAKRGLRKQAKSKTT
jgi:small GTP-binding protein